MKILVVGSTGFIGSYLVKHLAKKHTVFPLNRNTIDVFDSDSVRYVLERIQPDFVINCLSFGDDLGKASADVGKYLSSFYSFYVNRDLFGHYINIGSGIEETDSDSAYAFAKKLITARMNGEKWFNLILYGCFGKHEKPSRLLQKYITAMEEFKIQNDRYFDYISIQDFANIVSAVVDNIDNMYMPKKIVCTYDKKMKISEFLSMFCDINNLEKRYVVESESDIPYTGYSNLHEVPGLTLYGIGHGMREYIL